MDKAYDPHVIDHRSIDIIHPPHHTTQVSTEGNDVDRRSCNNNVSLYYSKSPPPDTNSAETCNSLQNLGNSTHIFVEPDCFIKTDDSADINPKKSFTKRLWKAFKTYLGFCGPGYLIAIGYMDPGNWETDIASGSAFSYSLLFIVFLSNCMAMILQYLAIRLGTISGLDLAQACAYRSSPVMKWILYILAELAMMATELAEIIGTAIALKLIFGIPLITGVVLTSLDVLVLLAGWLDPSIDRDGHEYSNAASSDIFTSRAEAERKYRENQAAQRRARVLEYIIITLMSIVALCFVLEWIIIRPDLGASIKAFFIPDFPLLLTNQHALFLALGIIGATVMPHNLYLHSYLVQNRIVKEESERIHAFYSSKVTTSPLDGSPMDQVCMNRPSLEMNAKQSTHPFTKHIKYATIDSTVALFFAMLLNSAILITAAAGLHDKGLTAVADIEDAAHLLSEYIGPAAGFLFGLALLACGQSSTITGTLTGQIVFEGFLKLKMKPWLRRLLTRSIALVPTIVVVLIAGDKALSDLLLLSQVLLSFHLPFAIIPLIWLNTDRKTLIWRWHKYIPFRETLNSQSKTAQRISSTLASSIDQATETLVKNSVRTSSNASIKSLDSSCSIPTNPDYDLTCLPPEILPFYDAGKMSMYILIPSIAIAGVIIFMNMLFIYRTIF